MKLVLISFLAGSLSVVTATGSASQPYDLTFSTYLGGSAGEGIRDVESDRFGNIYVAGTTRSPDFPTTAGAFDETVDISLRKSRWGYNSDIFVAKFSPKGSLLWSTVVGGPNSEEAYAWRSTDRAMSSCMGAAPLVHR